MVQHNSTPKVKVSTLNFTRIKNIKLFNPLIIVFEDMVGCLCFESIENILPKKGLINSTLISNY